MASASPSASSSASTPAHSSKLAASAPDTVSVDASVAASGKKKGAGNKKRSGDHVPPGLAKKDRGDKKPDNHQQAQQEQQGGWMPGSDNNHWHQQGGWKPSSDSHQWNAKWDHGSGDRYHGEKSSWWRPNQPISHGYWPRPMPQPKPKQQPGWQATPFTAQCWEAFLFGVGLPDVDDEDDAFLWSALEICLDGEPELLFSTVDRFADRSAARPPPPPPPVHSAADGVAQLPPLRGGTQSLADHGPTPAEQYWLDHGFSKDQVMHERLPLDDPA